MRLLSNKVNTNIMGLLVRFYLVKSHWMLVLDHWLLLLFIKSWHFGQKGVWFLFLFLLMWKIRETPSIIEYKVNSCSNT